MEAQLEQLDGDRVRLTVEVPAGEVHHAVEHATHDLADRVKVPGFRAGKVPEQVLVSRIGKERLYSEAVESHIGSWFWSAARTNRLRPDRAAPTTTTSCRRRPTRAGRFKAEFPVQGAASRPTGRSSRCAKLELEVPDEVVESQLSVLQSMVAPPQPGRGPAGPPRRRGRRRHALRGRALGSATTSSSSAPDASSTSSRTGSAASRPARARRSHGSSTTARRAARRSRSRSSTRRCCRRSTTTLAQRRVRVRHARGAARRHRRAHPRPARARRPRAGSASPPSTSSSRPPKVEPAGLVVECARDELINALPAPARVTQGIDAGAYLQDDGDVGRRARAARSASRPRTRSAASSCSKASPTSSESRSPTTTFAPTCATKVRATRTSRSSWRQAAPTGSATTCACATRGRPDRGRGEADLARARRGAREHLDARQGRGRVRRRRRLWTPGRQGVSV